MKRVLLVGIVILATATATARAQIGGCILLYSDPGWTSCEAMDTGAPVTVFVVHRFHTGVTSSRFRVVDYGTNWTYMEGTARRVRRSATTGVRRAMSGFSIFSTWEH